MRKSWRSSESEPGASPVKKILSVVLSTLAITFAARAQAISRSPKYAKLQMELQKGWNTWDTNTVLGQVLLPQGLEVRLGLKENKSEFGDAFLPTTLIGRRGKDDEEVHPGAHAYDGSYSELTLTWHGYRVKVQSAHAGEDMVILATPLSQTSLTSQPLTAVFSVGMLWNMPGEVKREESRISATILGKRTSFFLAGEDVSDLYVPLAAPYFSAKLDAPTGLSSGVSRSITQIEAIVEKQHKAYLRGIGSDVDRRSVVRDAIETTIAWDTIYEPHGKRVISPVSRIWNGNWGGYVLFDWDTFFAASLAAVDSRELAYANVLEILNEVTPQGFVPNYARAGGWKSSDRSEPPVGAITVLALYKQFHDRWLLEDTFDRLMRWNTWWVEHRQLDGFLCWGSDGSNQPTNTDDNSRGTLQGARFESGLDNSPMYDSASYNESKHLMELADVGLMSMHVADSDALAEIADVLGKPEEAAQLRSRASTFRSSLAKLWDSKTGIFLNKDLHTGQASPSLSPTNFYPLLAKVATPNQADEMVQKHLLNPEEFWGDRVMPSIARDDKAFTDQDYWRGRIWGPMNYLVYLGMKNYDTPVVSDARHQLADKSLSLFLQEWNEKGHVHENYSAVSEDSDTVMSSDRFYHWGALMGLIGYEDWNTFRK